MPRLFAAISILPVYAGGFAANGSAGPLPDAPTVQNTSNQTPAQGSSDGSAQNGQNQNNGPDQSKPGDKTSVTQGASDPESQQSSEQVLQQQLKQRILGVMPAFNMVDRKSVPPLTPGQKFRLMFKSTTDPFVFVTAGINAGIGQAKNSHAAYGQGVEGYAKRYGAAYADTADGNLWGNAILPVVLHEDPRYFRMGSGTIKRRLLYAISTTVMCRRDSGTWGPNYANVAGNFISGGISNLYYPPADRGLELTVQGAATVTAEGAIGSTLVEFWPDISRHYLHKRSQKSQSSIDDQTSAADSSPQ